METMGAREDIHHITRCGVQIGAELSSRSLERRLAVVCSVCRSLLLLNLPYARKKQRDKWVTTGELSALRGLLGQWLWLASSPCVDLGFDAAANSCSRQFCVFGCIDGSWPNGREGQCGRLIGITHTCFLDHAACHGTVEVGSSCKNLECS